jgi:hypothetical protein
MTKTATTLDVERLARELGVQPPPLPLSPHGGMIAEYLSDLPDQGSVEHDSDIPTLTPARREILTLATWANDQAWPGKSGTTDLHAFRAILAVAYTANKRVVAVSQYDLSEWIDVSNRTAWNALQRLQSRGVLSVPNHGRCPKCRVGKVVLKHRGRGGKHWPFYGCDRFPECDHSEKRDANLALTYRLVTEKASHIYVIHDKATSSPVMAKYDAELRQIPDAFRTPRGLSKGALPLIDHLDANRPQKVSALVRATNPKRSRATVYRYLKELGEYGIARKVAGGWILGEYDLDALAVKLDTTGAREAKRRYNEKRREDLKAALESTEAPRAQGVPEARIQAREGAMVPKTGTPVRPDGGTTISQRSAQPLPRDHGQRLPVEQGQGMGRHTPDLFPDDRPRLSVGGNELGNGTKEREAACLGCGQVQTFTAPDLRPYSCAYCKGKFEFVAVLMAA